MCNATTFRLEVSGSGKGAQGWFTLRQAQVYYDHPFHAQLSEAVIIDFLNEEQGPGARVAVELSAESARALAQKILESLEAGEHAHGL